MLPDIFVFTFAVLLSLHSERRLFIELLQQVGKFQ